MRRIKTFAGYSDEHKLDKDVNEYVEKLIGEEVVDVKYSSVVTDEDICHSIVLLIDK